jgi:hypothetical protein
MYTRHDQDSNQQPYRKSIPNFTVNGTNTTYDWALGICYFKMMYQLLTLYRLKDCKRDKPVNKQCYSAVKQYATCNGKQLFWTLSTTLIGKYRWSSESSGMYCCVLNWISTDVSEVRAASIIRAMTFNYEHGRRSQKILSFILAAVRTWNLT